MTKSKKPEPRRDKLIIADLFIPPGHARRKMIAATILDRMKTPDGKQIVFDVNNEL